MLRFICLKEKEYELEERYRSRLVNLPDIRFNPSRRLVANACTYLESKIVRALNYLDVNLDAAVESADRTGIG